MSAGILPRLDGDVTTFSGSIVLGRVHCLLAKVLPFAMIGRDGSWLWTNDAASAGLVNSFVDSS